MRFSASWHVKIHSAQLWGILYKIFIDLLCETREEHVAWMRCSMKASYVSPSKKFGVCMRYPKRFQKSLFRYLQRRRLKFLMLLFYVQICSSSNFQHAIFMLYRCFDEYWIMFKVCLWCVDKWKYYCCDSAIPSQRNDITFSKTVKLPDQFISAYFVVFFVLRWRILITQGRNKVARIQIHHYDPDDSSNPFWRVVSRKITLKTSFWPVHYEKWTWS